MSLPFDSVCLQCHLNRSLETARKLGTEEQAMAFARELMQIYCNAAPEKASPWISLEANTLLNRFYCIDGDRFAQEKQESNAFVMARLEQIREKVESAADPVLAGLRFSILGNYIDFSALQGEVSFEKLDAMLEDALEMPLDTRVYRDFCRELEHGKNLLYLTDNAGEIGFDRIFAEQIQKRYPHLSITFCVRGGNTQNDATRADAEAVGIPFPVIDNGNLVAGTVIDLLSPEARAAMDSADVILSKGQGNVETLLGCGYNIYYAFLVKCARFIRRFEKPKLTPMFVRERTQAK